MRQRGQLGDNVLPFWVVFQGDIARDPMYTMHLMSNAADQISNFYAECQRQLAGSTEPTFYPALQTLFTDFITENHNGQLHVQVNPSKVEGGMPDLRIEDKNGLLIGVVEVKHPSKVSNDQLLALCTKEQVERYREAFGVVLVTNLTRWILLDPHVGTTMKQLREAPQCTLAAGMDDEAVEADTSKQLSFLLDTFFSCAPIPESRPKPLAKRLARRAQILYEEVLKQVRLEAQEGEGELLMLLRNASTALRSDFVFKEDEEPPEEVMKAFADTIAQAVTYGLFYARLRDESPDQFTLGEAIAHFPQSVPVLYDIITLALKPNYRQSAFADAVRIIADVLRVCDPEKVKRELAKERKKDPVIYLYEDFLAEYNPEIRDTRGVYYTPAEVVQYMVKVTGEILEKHYGIASINDERVAFLDPAAGTGTFLLEFLRTALKSVQKARRRAWVQKAVAGGEDATKRRMFGFELLPAPYVILHQRINHMLEEMGAPLAAGERAGVFLTNTLENPEWELAKVIDKQGKYSHDELHKALHANLKKVNALPSFRKETEDATLIKQEAPILVIIGNPPWEAHSKNKSAFIEELINPYFFNEGNPEKGKLKGIKLSKWVRNDYVKFLRFAQWKIDEAPDPLPYGVVSMITDHSWLRSRVFGGMRPHILRHFSHVYIVDLHGNSRKREFPPEGKANEPVFAIQQGVAMAFFVKEEGHEYVPDGPLAEVRYIDLWGTYGEKADWLEKSGLEAISDLQELKAPHYKIGNAAGVEEGYDIEEVASEIGGRTGVMSGRDNFSTAFSQKEMQQRLDDLVNAPEAEFRQKYGKGGKPLRDVRDWNYEEVKANYHADPSTTPVVPILYRPFDLRWHGYGRVTSSVPGAMNRAFIDQQKNYAIILCPDSDAAGGEKWSSCWATHTVTDVNIFRRGGGYMFPLYMPDGTQGIRQEVLDALKEAYGSDVALEEAFAYLYGLFWTPAYREEFQADLLDGYPPVIFPTDYSRFHKIAAVGQELLEYHTLMSKKLSDAAEVVDFPESEGVDVVVNSPEYDREARRYYFNEKVYAEPIHPEEFDFSVGGYTSVLDDYVKERVGRVWTEEDYSHWVKAVDAIRKTHDAQNALDKAYPALRKELLRLEDYESMQAVLEQSSSDGPQQRLL